MKTMNTRQSKVAHEVQRTAAQILLQGRIPSTLPLARVTIVDCWVSADLRLARLYVQLPAGTPQADFLAKLNAQAATPMRKQLAGKLATKYIPQVSFHPAEDEHA